MAHFSNHDANWAVDLYKSFGAFSALRNIVALRVPLDFNRPQGHPPWWGMGLDKSRHYNRSEQWRKRGARRSRARRWASAPGRLIFVTVAAAGALAAQTAIQHSDSLLEINASNWVGPKPRPITGVASVIDGDTIEVHGQRIRFNGIDAPESKQYCEDATSSRHFPATAM
ncbi:hypothetical protein [Mesorhizobium sp. M1B.F.Ca.ET.045.04.1.1]|uniref:thermonuclease family protein n=1 Tax=Mesorhizobium sp. M1B.F.Ca.ET.045.04.1.1 TaxID=2493673 RepID=UPI002478BF72|nr:hypothetical protein [Mesorhizobium sp. M1B.F.Ca.ET.045.04.1.1]